MLLTGAGPGMARTVPADWAQAARLSQIDIRHEPSWTEGGPAFAEPRARAETALAQAFRRTRAGFAGARDLLLVAELGRLEAETGAVRDQYALAIRYRLQDRSGRFAVASGWRWVSGSLAPDAGADGLAAALTRDIADFMAGLECPAAICRPGDAAETAEARPMAPAPTASLSGVETALRPRPRPSLRTARDRLAGIEPPAVPLSRAVPAQPLPTAGDTVGDAVIELARMLQEERALDMPRRAVLRERDPDMPDTTLAAVPAAAQSLFQGAAALFSLVGIGPATDAT
ncbi:MAG: hypothetical protein D6754_06265, partial [Alphaproteobacteria bacterium]